MLLIVVLPKQNSFFQYTYNTLFTCWIIDVKTDFEVKEELENDWMNLICSLINKFKGRLDCIFIYYSIENYELRLEDTVIFLTLPTL